MFRLWQRQSHDTLIDFYADFIRINRWIKLERTPIIFGTGTAKLYHYHVCAADADAGKKRCCDHEPQLLILA